MFTVVILSEQAYDLYRDYQSLFVPFEEAGDLAICLWNKNAYDIDGALPDLTDLISGHKQWRAVVVDLPVDEQTLTMCNPYDFCDKEDSTSYLHESNVDIVRICHLLKGFPSLGVKDFNKTIRYTDTQNGEIVERQSDGIPPEELSQIRYGNRDGFSVYFKAVNYSEEEIARYRTTSLKYNRFENKPREVLLVTVNKLTRQFEKMRFREAWDQPLESQSSNFWRRNNYPIGVRFLTFCVEKSSYAKDAAIVFKFWNAVLCLAINSLSANALQAYRLYTLDVVFDNEELGRQLNRMIDTLRSVHVMLTERLEQSKLMFYGKRDELTFADDLYLADELDEIKKLYIEDYNERYEKFHTPDAKAEWLQDNAEKKKLVPDIYRLPERAIRKTIHDVRDRIYHNKTLIYEMNAAQQEDLEDYVFDTNRTMNKLAFEHLFFYNDMIKRLDTLGGKVAERIDKSLTAKQVWLLALICVASLSVGYLQFSFSAQEQEGVVFFQSLILTAISLLFLGLIGYYAISMIKHRFTESVEDYNESVEKSIAALRDKLLIFQQYLRHLLNYTKGYAVLSNNTKQSKQQKTKWQLMRFYQHWTERAVSNHLSWLEAYELQRRAKVVRDGYEFFDVSHEPYRNPLFIMQQAKANCQAELGDSGAKLRAPFSFVKKLRVDRLALYDQHDKIDR